MVVALCVCALGQWSALVTAGATTWRYDLYDPTAVRYQEPDYTACAATTTQMMLNTVYGQGQQEFGLHGFSLGDRFIPTKGPVFSWKPSTSYQTQEALLAYERAHMTMVASSAGTDAHGWRNGLNYFGWGSLGSGVYADQAFTTFDAAAKSVVHSIAVYGKPAGILAWYGGHAQYVTGYTVTGADPRTGSMDFTMTGIFLTDPLKKQAMRDTWLSYRTWRYGAPTIAFSRYLQKDSPMVDPIDGRTGVSEWYNRWVVIVAVR